MFPCRTSKGWRRSIRTRKRKESTHLFYLVKKPSLAPRIEGLIFNCIKTTSGESVCELELAKWVTGKRNLRRTDECGCVLWNVSRNREGGSLIEGSEGDSFTKCKPISEITNSAVLRTAALQHLFCASQYVFQ